MSKCNYCGATFDHCNYRTFETRKGDFKTQIATCPHCGGDLVEYDRRLAAQRMKGEKGPGENPPAAPVGVGVRTGMGDREKEEAELLEQAKRERVEWGWG